MPRRILDETKNLMRELYDKGLSIKDIAIETNVSYSAAYCYTRVRQRRNPKTGQLFKSITEYENYIAKKRRNPKTGQLFKSRTEYENYIAKKRRNPETGQLFKSITEYKNYMDRQRQHKSINQELSDLIKRRLKDLGKNQSWLARETRVTPQMVSLYAQGKFIPSDDVLKRLYTSLQVPYNTLNDLLE